MKGFTLREGNRDDDNQFILPQHCPHIHHPSQASSRHDEPREGQCSKLIIKYTITTPTS